jgi:serine/threonine-protein kinase Chk1
VSLLVHRTVSTILVETAVSSPSDTPWDEPSTASPEYKAYLTGELLQYDPWNNIPQDALGKGSFAPWTLQYPMTITMLMVYRLTSAALLLACLEVDPSKRITIPQIKTHRWLMS